jgi:hypothetical protein
VDGIVIARLTWRSTWIHPNWNRMNHRTKPTNASSTKASRTSWGDLRADAQAKLLQDHGIQASWLLDHLRAEAEGTHRKEVLVDGQLVQVADTTPAARLTALMILARLMGIPVDPPKQSIQAIAKADGEGSSASCVIYLPVPAEAPMVDDSTDSH